MPRKWAGVKASATGVSTPTVLPALERALAAAGPSLLELVLPATVGKPQ
ncbi:hypothetical protein N5K27_02270 [Pigmentiphaga sp. GD03639]|nr:hypothetical protein [Pigmentiphaga sp. GD03639]MDH2235114.1 hypothetical protein [Pigmentiphaga sp. GD03639]